MPHYAKPGHEPSDDEIAKHGYRAFAPRRDPLNPTPDVFARALDDMATGDPGELAKVAEEVAGWWPEMVWPFMYGYGYQGFDDD